MKRTLPTDSAVRKDVPLYSGAYTYFPAALAGVAKHSKMGNDKHNPGEPLHHARGKSMDHADCIARHSMDIADMEAHFSRGNDMDVPALLEEANALCWRALAWSQELHEKFGGAPLAPAARVEAGIVPTGWAKGPGLQPSDTVTVARKPKGFCPLSDYSAASSSGPSGKAKSSESGGGIKPLR